MPSLPGLSFWMSAMVMLPAAAAAAAPDPLAQYQGSYRVVVALAASAGDPTLAVQRRIFDGMRAGARERDLICLAATDDTPEGTALRRRFGGGTGFRVVLVGKDGGEKSSSDQPMGPRELFATIDAMPMRRAEMMRRTP